jgi:hypothetical protein
MKWFVTPNQETTLLVAGHVASAAQGTIASYAMD